MYVQINIGRNVGDTPMTSDRWNEFIQAAAGVLISAKAPGSTAPFMVHRGVGVWVDDDGERVYEDSSHISIFDEQGLDLDKIRAGLATLRDDFGQDSIALIVGSELI